MASEAAAAHFTCPNCGGKKLWKPQLAGRRAKCGCGQVITVPLQPPGADAPATFEDAFEAAAASPDVEPPPVVILKLCAVALAPGAVGSLADHWIGGFNGNMAGAFVAIGCYFALFLLLFRLPVSDQVVCVLILWIIRAGVAYLAFRLEG